MSRCRTRRECKYERPLAVSTAIDRRSCHTTRDRDASTASAPDAPGIGGGAPSRASALSRLPPVANSSTRHRCGGVSDAPNSRVTLGCGIVAIASASRRSSSIALSLSAVWRSVLTATSTPPLNHRMRRTCPNPPTPRSAIPAWSSLATRSDSMLIATSALRVPLRAAIWSRPLSTSSFMMRWMFLLILALPSPSAAMSSRARSTWPSSTASSCSRRSSCPPRIDRSISCSSATSSLASVSRTSAVIRSRTATDRFSAAMCVCRPSVMSANSLSTDACPVIWFR
mmetsp:Transcript_14698/g.35958  ORF Transcript_14698/g.35958 Transcript_14698/m.35958 type:complete len:284 (-) Transcript_14698:123-974(-)